MTIWDLIMLREEGERLDDTGDKIMSANVHAKYPFFDDGNGLKGNKNVSLALNWNIVPNAGLLPRIQGGKKYFEFPDNYW